MPGGRHQIGIPAGFNSESVAGFLSECLAGFIGNRIPHSERDNEQRKSGKNGQGKIPLYADTIT
jgi:hypothetical protein